MDGNTRYDSALATLNCLYMLTQIGLKGEQIPFLILIHCFVFYKGEDPLAGDQNDHDMDSIAGVLKLYFRGLNSPLFPKEIFHDLMSCVSKLTFLLVMGFDFLSAGHARFLG